MADELDWVGIEHTPGPDVMIVGETDTELVVRPVIGFGPSLTPKSPVINESPAAAWTRRQRGR